MTALFKKLLNLITKKDSYQDFNYPEAVEAEEVEEISIFSSDKLIPTEEIISIAKVQGVNFGSGNEHERIRYFIKQGLLPHAIRKAVSNEFLGKGKIEGHLPEWTIARLLQIQNLQKRDLTILQIKEEVDKGNVKLFDPKEDNLDSLYTDPYLVHSKAKEEEVFSFKEAPPPNEVKKFGNFASKLLTTGAFSVLTALFIFVFLTASYIFLPNQTTSTVKQSGFLSLFLSPVDYLAKSVSCSIAVSEICEKEPEVLIGFENRLTGSVLAETSERSFIEINSNLNINGALQASEATIAGKLSSDTLNTGFGDNELYPMNQPLTTTSAVSFGGLTSGTVNLTAAENQLVLGSGNTLTITTASPTSSRVATIPALSADDTFVFLAQTQTLTNKTMSGSSNTFSNIPVSALSSSKVTVSAGTGLSGGGDVSLGSSITLSSTLGTSVNLTSEVEGILPIANGGTGLSSYTTGDLIYASAANTLSKLAIGTNNYIMTVSGGVPTWQDSSVVVSSKWSALTDPTANLSLAHGSYTTAFTFNGITTEEAVKFSSSSITSGNIFDVTSSAAANFTGALLDINLSDGTGASSNTGSLLQLTNSGTANANTSLYIKHYATGTSNYALRVDDVDSDTSPFVIDGSGNVGIGTTNPGYKLEIAGNTNIVPSANTTALNVTGSSITSANLVNLDARNTSGTLFNLAYGAATTLAGSLTGFTVDLNSGNVIATNQDVTGVNFKIPTVTDTHTSGTKTLTGLLVNFGSGAGINQTGVGGTLEYIAGDFQLPALTQTTGTLNAYGLKVTTPSSITTGGTAYGNYISATGVGAGTLYGVGISNITGSGGTEYAFNVAGTGWDAVLRVGSTTVINGSGITQMAGGGTGFNTYAQGDLIYASAADTLAKRTIGNTGEVLVVSGGVPTWSTISGSSCTNCLVNNPTSTQTITPNANDITGLSVRKSSNGTPTADIFSVASNDGATKYFYVDKDGNVSTGAISNTTLTLTPTTNTTALTLVGTNVTSAKNQYINTKNSSGTILDLSYGAAQTLAGTVIGSNIDLSTNVTATDQAVTGSVITLPTVTNTITSGTKAYTGISIGAGGGINQNGAGGTTNFIGTDITIPALTQTAGALNAYGVQVTTPSSITTGGTAAGVYVNPTGVGAGTLYGVNIGGITGGSGTEYGLAIGSGWDRNLYFNDTTTNVLLADGGSITITDGSNTLCSITDNGSTGTLDCTGNITASGGTVGAWTRNSGSGFVYPATITDRVGIGTTDPSELLTVSGTGSFSGKVGIGITSSSSDYLLNLDGNTTNDFSRIINITQANNADESSVLMNVANTVNLGAASASRTVKNLDLSLTPTASLANAVAFDIHGEKNTVTLSNVTLGNVNTEANTVSAYGAQHTITGTPVYNAALGIGEFSNTINAYGIHSATSLTPTLTAMDGFEQMNSYGGYFSGQSTSAGHASLTATNYGIYAQSVSNLTTTGTTTHYGAYFTVSGTADNNYGININSVASGTNNYGLYIDTVASASTNFSIYSGAAAKSYFAGSVGIGTTTPNNALEILSTTTPQLRIAYDTSNYMTTAVASNGAVTFDTNGAGAAFAFSDGVTANTFASSGATLTGGTINNMTIGASTPSTGAFTTLSASSTFTANGIANIGDGGDAITLNGTTVDIDASGALQINSSGGAISIGNDAVAQAINIGNGAAARTITIGNNTGATGLVLTTGTAGITATTTATTGNGFSLTANSLTTGTALSLTSTSITSGKFLDINNGSSIFSVSNTAFSTSLPTEFSASGDVSIAYDLNFTNPTSSYIKSAAPLYIQAGETFNSSDLTLKTYNQGSIVFDVANTTTTAVDFTNATLTSGIGFNITASALTTGTGISGTFNALSTGTALSLSSSSTAITSAGLISATLSGNPAAAWTGSVGLFEITGNDADIDGSALKVGITSSSTAGSASTALNVTSAGPSGAYVVRFNDDGTYTDSTPFVIDDAGNVGIGTTAPARLLNLRSADANTRLLIQRIGVNSTDDNTLQFTGQAASDNSTDLLGINFEFTNAAGSVGSGAAKIVVGKEADWSVGANADGFMAFYTAQNASYGERARINSSGHLGIGTTNPTARLHINAGSTTTDDNIQLVHTGAADGTHNVISYLDQGGSSTWQIKALNVSDAAATADFAVITRGAASAFVIKDSGNVGIGTTGPESRVQVSGGGLCVGSDANCNTDNNTEGIVYSSSTSMTVYDVAENYPTKDLTLNFEEIVELDETNHIFVKRSTTTSPYTKKLLGIVSEKPGVLLGGFNGEQFREERQVAIALSGRVPVKMAPDSEAVEIGDLLTASNTYPGKAMRATKPGYIIGRSMEKWNAVNGNLSGNGRGDSVMVYVSTTYADPSNVLANLTIDPVSGNLILPETTVEKINLSGIKNVTLPTINQLLDPSSSPLTLVGTAASGEATTTVDLATAINSMSVEAIAQAAKIKEIESKEASNSALLADQGKILKQVQDDSSKQESKIGELVEKTASQSSILTEAVNSTTSKIADLSSKIAEMLASMSGEASTTLSQYSLSELEASRSATLSLVDPSILLATDSATIANLDISNQLSAISIKTLDATVSGTLKSLGETFLGRTIVAGDFSVDGTMSVSGNSINSIGNGCSSPLPSNSSIYSSSEECSDQSRSTLGVLYIQNSPLASLVDFFNGKVKIDKEGKLAVEEFAAGARTVGSAIIKAGESEIPVVSEIIKSTSKVFVTPTSEMNGTLIVPELIEGAGFVVKVTAANTRNINFNWFVVQER